MRQVCLLLLGLALGPWGLGARAEDNPDLGPEDPGFVANTGELESEVNPQQKPKGNYHIIQVRKTGHYKGPSIKDVHSKLGLFNLLLPLSEV